MEKIMKCLIKCSKLAHMTWHEGVDGGARDVIVIVVGNGHGDKSSNPGRDLLHFT